MTDFILHHYDNSPFAEKVRLMLGFKGLRWGSVKIPPVMPKPDVLALTGGYRKTPLLQRGADVYCDTALIAQVLEAHAPSPTLFPSSAPLAPVLAQWADSTLFWTVVPYTMQPAGLSHMLAGMSPESLKAFAADRAAFTSGMRRQTAADAQANLQQHLTALNAQLADGRPWLLGPAVSMADFSVAHCLWFLQRGGPLASILQPQAHLRAWLPRVLNFGHGQSQAMTSAEALAVSASAPAHAPCQVLVGLGFEAGQPVMVAATDYGTDPVAGTLVGLSNAEVVLRRNDERAGAVHVHFPRSGFQIKAEAA